MVSAVCGFLFTLASLLFRGIVMFFTLLIFQTIWVDCFACGILVTILLSLSFGINWFAALLLGAGMVAGLAFAKNTKVGYWLIANPISLVWGALFGLIACMIASGSGPDGEMAVMFTTLGIASTVAIGLHMMNWYRYGDQPKKTASQGAVFFDL